VSCCARRCNRRGAVSRHRSNSYARVRKCLSPPSVERRPELTTTTHAFALHRSPALFLQIATQFATIGATLFPSQPIRLDTEDKLAALRRLDRSRAWNSLDDQLYCTICKNVISGSQIEVVGGTNGLRALRLKCPTPGCFSTPADWTLPHRAARHLKDIELHVACPWLFRTRRLIPAHCFECYEPVGERGSLGSFTSKSVKPTPKRSAAYATQPLTTVPPFGCRTWPVM
jgi:hypothetical protein